VHPGTGRGHRCNAPSCLCTSGRPTGRHPLASRCPCVRCRSQRRGGTRTAPADPGVACRSARRCIDDR
jgi:hypothetical protein